MFVCGKTDLLLRKKCIPDKKFLRLSKYSHYSRPHENIPCIVRDPQKLKGYFQGFVTFQRYFEDPYKILGILEHPQKHFRVIFLGGQ